jgi:phosphatidylglycerophosphatase A
MNAARLVASGLGAGRFPVAPGTVGSLLALLAGAGLMRWSPWALPAATVLAALGGIWAIARSGAVGDPGWVVIDEVAGQWLAMIGLGRAGWPGLVLAFVLFRLLDVAKPGPVGWADRREGPVAIMADDLIAGAIACAILWAVRARYPGIVGAG